MPDHTNAESIAPPTFFGRLFRIFAPAPAVPIKSTDPVEVAKQYGHWQKRVLLSSIIGYATFYFVRANIPIAMPFMERNLGIQKQQLGLFLTLHGLLYGVSKFANGFLGDRANARAFMAFGLGASALMNVLFGFNSAVVTLGLIWMANGWFQGMGFPPCARLLTNWFSPKQLATKMSIWNISHQIGGDMRVLPEDLTVTSSEKLPRAAPRSNSTSPHDGGGMGKGATVKITINDKLVGQGASPDPSGPASPWRETFDTGMDTGSR